MLTLSDLNQLNGYGFAFWALARIAVKRNRVRVSDFNSLHSISVSAQRFYIRAEARSLRFGSQSGHQEFSSPYDWSDYRKR